MEFDQFDTVYVIKLDPEEEAMASLKRFADFRGIQAAYFHAIGAFRRVRLSYFDVRQNQYRDHQLDLQLEVVSLLGSIARKGKEPILHVHATLADAESRTYSGHLGEGIVRPTLEVFLTTLRGELRRTRDAATGLELLDLPETLQA
jgi:uncharacterized protein